MGPLTRILVTALLAADVEPAAVWVYDRNSPVCRGSGPRDARVVLIATDTQGQRLSTATASFAQLRRDQDGRVWSSEPVEYSFDGGTYVSVGKDIVVAVSAPACPGKGVVVGQGARACLKFVLSCQPDAGP